MEELFVTKRELQLIKIFLEKLRELEDRELQGVLNVRDIVKEPNREDNARATEQENSNTDTTIRATANNNSQVGTDKLEKLELIEQKTTNITEKPKKKILGCKYCGAVIELNENEPVPSKCPECGL